MARVLYVEDNADNRMLVRRILMAYGHTVDEAGNAPDGLALAEAHMPDLILMDLSMPGMDGIMATHKLRESPTLRHIPIVALTANVREQDRKLTEEAGCDGFIGKPIDVDTFPDLVSSYLRSPRRDDGQQRHHTTPDDPTLVSVARDTLTLSATPDADTDAEPAVSASAHHEHDGHHHSHGTTASQPADADTEPAVSASAHHQHDGHHHSHGTTASQPNPLIHHEQPTHDDHHHSTGPGHDSPAALGC